MDNNCPEAASPIYDIADSNVPAVTASLEMLTVTSSLSPSPAKKRVLRKKIPKKIVATESLNRRCSRRPKKRIYSDMESDDDVKDYYLDKTIKRATNALETIYEEQESMSDCARFMSAKRYKRMIQFQDSVSESKIKKRRAKIKKIFGTKFFVKKLGIRSRKALMDQLHSIGVVFDESQATTTDTV